MTQKIEMNRSVREKNDHFAAENKVRFKAQNLKSFNLISSPGSGKTTLLESLGQRLGNSLAVIVGDLATTRDADRIRKSGCQAVQIETGGGCHLNAEMVQKAYAELDLANTKTLIIENVGNLVCPAAWDLGEDKKIAMLSVPEGDDKVAKYPTLFMRADLILISKIDLLPIMDFDLKRVQADCAKLNPHSKILLLSAKTGEGMDALQSHLI